MHNNWATVSQYVVTWMLAWIFLLSQADRDAERDSNRLTLNYSEFLCFMCKHFVDQHMNKLLYSNFYTMSQLGYFPWEITAHSLRQISCHRITLPSQTSSPDTSAKCVSSFSPHALPADWCWISSWVNDWLSSDQDYSCTPHFNNSIL